MSSSGVKRTRSELEHEEAASKGGLNYGEPSGSGSGGDRTGGREGEKPVQKKPRDWREAFLDDDDVIDRDVRDRGSYGRDDRDRRDRDYSRDRYDRRGDSDRYRDDRRHDNRQYGTGYNRGGSQYDDQRERDRRADRHRGKNSGGGQQSGGNRANGDARYSSGMKGNYERGSGADRHMSPQKRDDRSIKGRQEDEEEGEIPDNVSNNTLSPSRQSRSHTINHQPQRSTSIIPAPVPSDIAKPLSTPTIDEGALAGKVLNPDEPEDLEAILEERRRKRRELLEKFAGTQSGVASTVGSQVDGATSVQSKTSNASVAPLQASASKIVESMSSTPNPGATPSTTQIFDLTKQDGNGTAADVLPSETTAADINGEKQISAADYDPLDDRKADDDRSHLLAAPHIGQIKQSDIAAGVGEPGPDIINAGAEEAEEDEYEAVEVEEEDEEFDMFAIETAPKVKKTIRRKKFKNPEPAKPIGAGKIAPALPVLDVSTLLDNFDDHEGYYRITPGEILDGGKYQVTVNLGKGMFSAVIRAKVLKATEKGEIVGGEVAIKVIRSQESMYVAGRKEAGILAKLCAADPDDKKHIVRLFRTFEHRGHLCLVTESLSMNLRDVVKRFGKDVGLNLRAVRAYAHQMFLALSLMKKCNIVHADIKPDNILVTENKAVLKVCDLGSACDASESDITPYLVSRFYRAPEIILGLPYDESLDMWSIGCTLYELYTGKILFPGRSNNQMLMLMMDLKGKFNHKMIKKAQFGTMHFDEGMNFISVEKDKITGNDVIKTVVINKASRDLKARLLPSSAVQVKMKEEDIKLLISFVDLLDKCLMLDPAKRLSAREALLHPFLSSP